MDNCSNSNKSDSKLNALLEETQLESFACALREKLQITRLSHFDHLKVKDLEKVGMSKPAIRRLIDTYNRHKRTELVRRSFVPVRAPPPPPSPSFSLNSSSSTSLRNNQTPSSVRFHDHDQQTRSRLYNNNIKKSISKLSNNNNNTMRSNSLNGSSKSSSSASSVTFIINSADLIVLNNVVLGQGQFGKVFKGLWKKPGSNNKEEKINVAVKCLHDQSKMQTVDLLNEISCMCGLNHPNLIKLYGIVLNDQKNISMVTELAPYGSLLNYLREVRRGSGEDSATMNNLPINRLYSYTYQIAYGMSYLESKQLIHRDLAARNILLVSLDQIKIGDFGMSRSVKNSDEGLYMMSENQKIPCAWYPPESIKAKQFSLKSDVWMFAVTIWEIFTMGEQPWPHLNAAQILQKITVERQRLPIPKLCSKQLYLILNECWSHESAARPSFQLLHKLIRTIKIVEMKAKDNFKKDETKHQLFEIVKGDKIVIIEGNAANYWWSGQNQRTMRFGRFPRAILDPQRKLNSEDISMPLKNSFIHTGHMSAISKEKSWGELGKIDELFLRNPLTPPDLNTDDDDCECEQKEIHFYDQTESESEEKNRRELKQQQQQENDNEVNLINFLDSSSTDYLRVTFPEYCSFSNDEDYSTTTKSKSLSPSLSSTTTTNTTNNNNANYINESYQRNLAVIQTNLNILNLNYHNNHHQNKMDSNGRPISSSSTNNNCYYNLPQIKLNSISSNINNPFAIDLQQQKHHQLQYFISSSSSASDSSSLSSAKRIFDFKSTTASAAAATAADMTESSNNHSAPPKSAINLDDYLSKVMKDVLNDLSDTNNTINAANNNNKKTTAGDQIKC